MDQAEHLEGSETLRVFSQKSNPQVLIYGCKKVITLQYILRLTSPYMYT